MCWILRTGAPWQDLPEAYGPWQTVATRFYRWTKTGLLQRLWEELQRQADAAGTLDWDLHFAVGSVIRAHQQAAGAKKERPDTTPADETLGRSQGGFSTTVPLRAERGGKPLVFVLTAGQRPEQTAFRPLMERGAVKRAGRGRPRLRPKRLAADKGYSSGAVRPYLRRRGSGAVIPRKSNERRAGRFDRSAYRERTVIERTINRLKQFRRIATRYEKRAATYLAMLTLASILLWL